MSNLERSGRAFDVAIPETIYIIDHMILAGAVDCNSYRHITSVVSVLSQHLNMGKLAPFAFS